MGTFRTCLLAAALGALATPAPGRDRLRPLGTPAQKSALPLPGKPIEPKAERDEKPAAGWAGFYFGLNAGAAGRETNH